MRIITSYACTLDVDSADEAAWRFSLYQGVLDDWLLDQGVRDPRADSPSGTYIQLERRDVSYDGAEIAGFLLKQPILSSSHLLHTRFDLGLRSSSLALFCQLSLERKTSRIAPVNTRVTCPRALATILETGRWRSGRDQVRPSLRFASGLDAGRQLAENISDPHRTTPIVLLANLGTPDWTSVPRQAPYPEDPWRGFVSGIESAIGGLAQIVEVDSAASEPLDSDMDGILVRLLWPLGEADFLDEQHPAWAPFDYYFELDDAEDPLAYDIHYGGTGNPNPPWITVFRRHELLALLPQVRDLIREQAAWQPVPPLIDEIQQAFEIAERERHAEDEDWEQIAESYQRDAQRERKRADREEARADAREREVDSLKGQLKVLQHARQQKQVPRRTIDPVLQAAAGERPANVLEALRLASEDCGGLVWGQNVWDSASKIESEPALAEKVLSALKALDQGTRAASEGQLGNTLAGWLHDQHGFPSSPDAEDRQFLDDRGTSVRFSMHLKLKEATAANKAVRIYFEHRPKEGTTLVGYVGPHL